MSFPESYNFFADEQDIQLHEMFRFANTVECAAGSVPLPPSDLFVAPRLASPFAEPLEAIQDQPVGWLSPCAADPVDSLNTVDFNDFLALDDESVADRLAVTQDLTSSAPPPPPSPPFSPPPDLAGSGFLADDITDTIEASEVPPDAAKLEAAQAEISRLEATLAIGSPQHELVRISEDCKNSSSPLKRKAVSTEDLSPKRQFTEPMGPIETLWSTSVPVDDSRAFQEKWHSPRTPPPAQDHLESSLQAPNLPTSGPSNLDISPEDLHFIQAFLRNNPALIHGTSHQVSTSTIASDFDMASHPVNSKVERVPLERTPKPSLKSTIDTNSKVTKIKATKVKATKMKATPKKSRKQQATTIAAVPSTPPTATNHHRSIDELLAANFYGLNEQEKCRVLLPMLRNLDPRELETSLAKLSSIQAKGAGHELRVARAIRKSPPTPEADAILATKLTSGAPPTPTSATKTRVNHTLVPVTQALSSQRKISKVEVGEDHGAIRQREALEKAALLHAQGRKR